MMQGLIFISIFVSVLIFNGCFAGLINRNVNPNKDLNTMQIIRKYGYPVEAYTVETKDGYLLEMHRIPYGKEGKKESKYSIPIFLQHGFLCSSIQFVFTGPQRSLAFILADMGFDVWMGNVRGNSYSRAHVSLLPSDIKFWNFTWHESGIYDMPAMIDFILATTGQEKVMYIGHSMGTTTFFVPMSMLPEYNDKVEAGFMMAPIAYLGHQRSPLITLGTMISEEFLFLDDIFGHGEFLPNTRLYNLIARLLCGSDVEYQTCLNIIYLIIGDDPREYDRMDIDLLIDHFPEGYSGRALEHYSQLAKSNEFRMYSYGRSGNMRQYGTPIPPSYALNNIKTPTYFYVGKNDYLADVTDVDRLANEMPNLRKYFLVDYCKFAHLDFIMGRDVRTQLYNYMIDDILNHLKEKGESNGKDTSEENGGMTRKRIWDSSSYVSSCGGNAVYSFLPNKGLCWQIWWDCTNSRLKAIFSIFWDGQICKDEFPGLQSVCSNVIFLLCGFDEPQLNVTMLPAVLGHVPAGASTKQLIHSTQSINKGDFRQFDFGRRKNIKKYGTAKPPKYDLMKINVPLAIYYAQNDWLNDAKDVQRMKGEIPNIISDYTVPFSKFNHLDFVFATDVKFLVYDKLLEVLEKYR